MGHPDAVKGRVGQAESGKKEFLPAGGRAARDGRFLPTTQVDVNRNGPFINARELFPARPGRNHAGPGKCRSKTCKYRRCQIRYIV
jgi:hypothetical protein